MSAHRNLKASNVDAKSPPTPRAKHLRPPCAACGTPHRPGRYSKKARECLTDEAQRMTRAAQGAIDLMTKGHSPSDYTLMAMLVSLEAFAKAVDEHLRGKP